MVDRPKTNPMSEEILADDSEHGADGVAALPDRLVRYSRAHQRALHMSNYAMERGERKLAAKLDKCGDWLVFRHYYTVDKLRLHAADFCKKHLLCPLCAIRRGAKYLKAYLEKYEVVRLEHPAVKSYMVSVTTKNGESLGERFNHLRNGMKAMSQARRDHLKAPSKNRHVEAAKAIGGVHSIEFKRGANSGLWHPHAHMIWLCHEAPDPVKLSEEWKHWTGDSFIVDVRPIDEGKNGDLVSGFVEVFKYALKFSELPLDDNWEAFQTLSGKRLVDSFGVLRGVDVPDDLADAPLDDLPFIELFYKYAGGAVGYNLMASKPQGKLSISPIIESRPEPVAPKSAPTTYQRVNGTVEYRSPVGARICRERPLTRPPT